MSFLFIKDLGKCHEEPLRISILHFHIITHLLPLLSIHYHIKLHLMQSQHPSQVLPYIS
jgi:hypothetical protein